jgi:hypothetical protein
MTNIVYTSVLSRQGGNGGRCRGHDGGVISDGELVRGPLL